jgi:hypothetical protein
VVQITTNMQKQTNNLDKFNLTNAELLSLLSVSTLIQMHTDLHAQLSGAKPMMQAKISMQLSLLQTAYNNKLALQH